MTIYCYSGIWFDIYLLCLEDAAKDTHTVYHSRIDGALLPYRTVINAYPRKSTIEDTYEPRAAGIAFFNSLTY